MQDETQNRSDQREDSDDPARADNDPRESSSRVSVVDESPPRPDPPDGASDDDYKWHTYKVYPSGRPDAVEFIDTYKAFGRIEDPPGPEHGPAGGHGLDDPRAVGHRQVGLHQAHGRAAVPRPGRHPRARRVGAQHARRRPVRHAQEVRAAVPGRRAVRLDEPLRQRRLPAAPAHREGRGRDRGHRHAPPERGRPRPLAHEDAQRALRRDAQARRVRAGAGAGAGHRAVRRARLRAWTRCAPRCSAS